VKPDQALFENLEMRPWVRKFGIHLNCKRAEVFFIAVAFGSFSPSAFAYLDPSTGSMILSAIVGLFATVGLAVKTYWYKLKSLLGGSKLAAVDDGVSAIDSAAGNDTEKSSVSS
jgi:hypothetical protein